ncbi:5-hydroxytryptamine receptor 2B-like [Branchiostoma floridae]|uniref:5-hydroxytryptamine receptor 2B-like n=1 Tax=Branchiostoma floridae TaxID=7739 RepID=A0A9J7LCS8_BRAFL|nr:5-hydroxytryptamine receptor 2B-like [Branchiostoma floridae]
MCGWHTRVRHTLKELPATKSVALLVTGLLSVMANNSSHVDVNESHIFENGSFSFHFDNTWDHSLPVVIALCFLGLSGAAGNAIVAIVGLKRQEKTSARCYIISLSLVDFVVCTVVIPLEIYNLTNQFSFYNDGLCKTYIWLSDFTMYASFLIHVAVAADRYWVMKTVHNTQAQMYQHFFSKTVTFSHVSILIIVVASGLISILGCVGYESVPLLLGTDLYACTNTRFIDLGYASSWIRTCLSFSSILVMCILYVALFCGLARRVGVAWPPQVVSVQVRPVSRLEDSSQTMGRGTETSMNSSQRQHTGGETDFEIPSVDAGVETIDPGAGRRRGAAARHEAVTTEGRAQQRQSGHRTLGIVHRTAQHARLSSRNVTIKKVYRSAKLLALITAVFVLTWLPEWVLHLLLQVDINLYHRLMAANQFDFAEGALCLRFINNAVNPIIFLFLNSEFRQDCKRLVCCVRRSR